MFCPALDLAGTKAACSNSERSVIGEVQSRAVLRINTMRSYQADTIDRPPSKLKSGYRALAAFTLALALPACVFTTNDDDGLLSVVNDSSFVIEEVRVASIGSQFYGPDLLGVEDLYPGESVSVRLQCDFYDVLFVDEAGLECEVLDVDVCISRTIFVIDDILLDDCAFSAREP